MLVPGSSVSLYGYQLFGKAKDCCNEKYLCFGSHMNFMFDRFMLKHGSMILFFINEKLVTNS